MNNNNFLCNKLDIGHEKINVTFECLDDIFNVKFIEINIIKGHSFGMVKGKIISKKLKPIIGFTTEIQVNDFDFDFKTINAYNIINNFNISNLCLLNYNKKGHAIFVPDKENGDYKKIKIHLLKYDNHSLVKSCGLHSEISQGCGGGGGGSIVTISKDETIFEKDEIPQIKWECDKCDKDSSHSNFIRMEGEIYTILKNFEWPDDYLADYVEVNFGKCKVCKSEMQWTSATDWKNFLCILY